MIVDSTNPRVMADNIRELAKNAGGSELPEVTAADNGKILGVVEGSWNKMDAPSNAIDYSTTEQDTGLKWIDGKPIYQITVNTTLAADGDYTVFESGIDKAFLKNSILEYSEGRFMSPDYSGLSAASTRSCYVEVNNNALTLHNQSNSVGHWIATIQYTKVTEAKSTKRKTTKGEN